jgi:hypothetical protein
MMIIAAAGSAGTPIRGYVPFFRKRNNAEQEGRKEGRTTHQIEHMEFLSFPTAILSCRNVFISD